MTTSNDPDQLARPTPDGVAAPSRPPVRLALSDRPGKDALDGGWWPRSRDLGVELADLVDQFPPHLGRITRVLVSPPDWSERLRSVRVARGMVKVGSFPRDDTHVVHLTMSSRTRLCVLVVPPDLTEYEGEEALLAASTAGNSHSASDLLATVTDQLALDPRDHWT